MISGILCIPVRSNAAPLICQSVQNGITTLVPVLGTSCAAAFVAHNTSSIPGLVNNTCPKVVGGDLVYVSCSGISLSDFPTGITTGVPGSDGPFAIVASSGGPVTFNTRSPGCITFNACDLAINDSSNGDILLLTAGGQLKIAADFQATAGSFLGAVSATTGFTAGVSGTDGPGLSIIGSACSLNLVTTSGHGQISCGSSLTLSATTSAFDHTLSANNGGASGLVGINKLIAAVDVADTYHCIVSDLSGLTAGGSSTVVAIGSSAYNFSSSHYVLLINDDTDFSVVVVTAKATTGFTFTSTSGHVYSYQACGE